MGIWICLDPTQSSLSPSAFPLSLSCQLVKLCLIPSSHVHTFISIQRTASQSWTSLPDLGWSQFWPTLEILSPTLLFKHTNWVFILRSCCWCYCCCQRIWFSLANILSSAKTTWIEEKRIFDVDRTKIFFQNLGKNLPIGGEGGLMFCCCNTVRLIIVWWSPSTLYWWSDLQSSPSHCSHTTQNKTNCPEPEIIKVPGGVVLLVWSMEQSRVWEVMDFLAGGEARAGAGLSCNAKVSLSCLEEGKVPWLSHNERITKQQKYLKLFLFWNSFSAQKTNITFFNALG